MKIESLTDEEMQRYRVLHRADIEQVLQEILHSQPVVTMVSADRLSPILTTRLLQVAKGRLWLEGSPDGLITQILLKSRNVLAVTEQDMVQVRIPCRGLGQDVDPQLGTVLTASYPTELLRLQRRDSYRLGTSVIHPVKCLIRNDDNFMETNVIDLSISGVGILAYKAAGELSAGETYHGCRLNLPEAGEFAVSLTVKSTYDVARPDGRTAHRAGCQFLDLPPSIETQIQRYILRVDRERRARFT